MAEDESRAPFATRLAFFDGPAILRLGLWTLAAGVAVALAVLVGSSETGLRRIGFAMASLQGVQPPQAREAGSRDNGEMQRLSDGLNQITMDRYQTAARLGAIERHLDDLTGSINRNTAAARAPETVPPVVAPPETAAAPVPPPVPAVASRNPPAPSQKPAAATPAHEPTVADAAPTPKVDFGVDLGSAQTIDGLRVLWTSAKGRHGGLLEGMRPIIVIREGAKSGSMELRLVVGPLPSAALAARLCVVMTAAGAVCQPAVFDGQRLALR